DYQGRQVACEHGTHRVVRYEHDGSVTMLAEIFNGKPLNAPNDVVVHPNDGSIWFTDPGYGSLLNYEGHRANTGSVQPFQKEANVWSSAGWVGDGYDGVHIFAPNGDRIGQIRLPEICSNVCFGGSKRNRLFMTGSQSLYAVYVETRGAHIT